MAKTVDDLRNEIRLGVGRFEREISATFTKEDLAAICSAVGFDIDRDRLPSTSTMRAGILREIGERSDDAGAVDRSFRKAELEAIAAALETD